MVGKHLDSQYIEREVPGVSAEQRFSTDTNERDFAYGLFAGLSRKINGPWRLSTRLQYLNLGELTVAPYPNRDARARADLTTIEVQFSVERDL